MARIELRTNKDRRSPRRSITLNPYASQILDEHAAQDGQTASGYLADLIIEADTRMMDALATLEAAGWHSAKITEEIAAMRPNQQLTGIGEALHTLSAAWHRPDPRLRALLED